MRQDSNGNYIGYNDIPCTTPDNKTPIDGTPVKIHDGTGTQKTGVWRNNQAEAD